MRIQPARSTRWARSCIACYRWWILQPSRPSEHSAGSLDVPEQVMITLESCARVPPARLPAWARACGGGNWTARPQRRVRARGWSPSAGRASSCAVACAWRRQELMPPAGARVRSLLFHSSAVVVGKFSYYPFSPDASRHFPPKHDSILFLDFTSSLGGGGVHLDGALNWGLHLDGVPKIQWFAFVLSICPRPPPPTCHTPHFPFVTRPFCVSNF